MNKSEVLKTGMEYKAVVFLYGIKIPISMQAFNPLNAELNPICHLLALLGAHHIFHVSRIRVKFSSTGCTYVEYL